MLTLIISLLDTLIYAGCTGSIAPRNDLALVLPAISTATRRRSRVHADTDQ